MSLFSQLLLPIFFAVFSIPEKTSSDSSPLAFHPGCVQSDHQWVVINTAPQPINVTAATGGSCSGNYTYQWQMSYDDISFVNIPGATSLNLTYTGLITQTTYFQRRATCGNEIKYTQSIEVETAAQLYYNTAKSGNFTRNNCPYPNYSVPVPYSVPANKYSSPYPGVADDEATDELNNDGQANANAVGVCCLLSVTWNSGVMDQNEVISIVDSTVTFLFAVGWPGGTSLSLGTLNGNCLKPTATRTIPFVFNSASFQLTITPAGAMTVTLVSGTMSPGYFPVKGSYNIKVPGFYSAAAGGTYYRNNCPAGQVGSGVAYNVPIYKYFSIVSQAAANLQATNEAATYGQSNANSVGTCTQVNQVTGSNNKSVSYGVQFMNTSTSATYNFYIPFNSVNYAMGNLPTGYYKVTFMPTGGPTTYVNFSIGSYSQYSVVNYVFPSVYINSNISASVF